MSPEQVRGKEVDERSDIYSLGCMMYEMLTGHPPFQGKNPAEIMFKHVEQDPDPLNKQLPQLSLPVGLERAVWRSLDKEKKNRPQSMIELKQELERSRSPI